MFVQTAALFPSCKKTLGWACVLLHSVLVFLRVLAYLCHLKMKIMKKLLFICVLLSVAGSVWSQIKVTSGNCYPCPNPSGVDYVYLFAGLDNAEISYTGTETPVMWYKFDGTNVASGINELSPEDATGYILKAGKDSVTFWVIDYSAHLPVFTDFYVQPDYEYACENTLLMLEGSAPNFEYYTPQGIKKTIYRKFTLEWQTLQWAGENWETVETQQTVSGFSTNITAPPAYVNTAYTLSGDQFAAELGLQPVSIQTAEYMAVAIRDTILTTTVTRDALNESDRPSTTTALSGSAPLEVLFTAVANEPVAEYYQWKIYKDSALIVQRSDREHRYTFNEFGNYTVNLMVTNSYGCMDSTTVTVDVMESMLEVPNVFTPNGDGKNDEFRVAYKSIIEFHGWIYNRWGRKVFEWTDPTKGWNGTINGRSAAAGVYFYIIQGKGSDGVEYKRKGDVTLLR